MKILKRYVLGRFLQIYLLTLFGFMGIFEIIDFFERADEFVKHDAELNQWASYYFYKIPLVFSYMAPQAILLASVITLTTLSRTHEITAMKACGIGVTGTTSPILVSSLVISVLVLASNEFLMPTATETMNHIYKVEVRGKPVKFKFKRDNIWFRSADGSIWNIDFYDPDRSMMKNVSIFVYDGKNFIQRRIDSSAVFWNGRNWEFLDGYIRTFRDNGLAETEYFKKKVFLVTEKPDDFKKVKKKPEEMSIREMYQEILDETHEGTDTTKKWVDLQQKLSYPFVTVILAMIGIPLSLRTSRSGGLLFCVGVSLAVGLSFSFFYAMGISLGHSGTFSPTMAAWGPLALFAAAGLYLILTMDSETLLPT